MLHVAVRGRAAALETWLSGFEAAARTLPCVANARTSWRPPATVVFVLGGPGSGKGTVCKRAARELSDWAHLSAGDLLRAEQDRGGEHAGVIRECIVDGTIVPVEITVDLLLRAIRGSSAARFMVDGFPRDTRNLAGWQRAVRGIEAATAAGEGDEFGVAASHLLCVECSEPTMRARIMQRGKTSGRADDNETSIAKRFDIFRSRTSPVLEFFDELGELHSIDGDQPANAVWDEARELLAAVEAGEAQREHGAEMLIEVERGASDAAVRGVESALHELVRDAPRDAAQPIAATLTHRAIAAASSLASSY
jgi:UMP-CMP kinase